MLSEQLSNEISLKEELAKILGDEREKNVKVNQLLANANKSNVELKKKITKMENSDKG